jgi:hypothetical protein
MDVEHFIALLQWSKHFLMLAGGPLLAPNRILEAPKEFISPLNTRYFCNDTSRSCFFFLCGSDEFKLKEIIPISVSTSTCVSIIKSSVLEGSKCWYADNYYANELCWL